MSQDTEREDFEARIREFVGYEPSSGRMYWKRKPNRNIVLGSQIGRPNHWGHWSFAMGGKTLMVHRVAWFLHYGQWPEHQIDHINGDKSDNRIANLRDVPQNKNMQNQSKGHSGSASGLLGVHRNPNSATNPWESSIKVNGQRVYLGRFPTKEAAHDAYKSAKEALHDTGR